MAPGNNSECVVAPGQTAYLRSDVFVPHNANNDPVGRVRWYRSLDLVTSEDVSGDYEVLLHYSSIPISFGHLTGLFRNVYALVIRNVSYSDNGYYWCQIIANETCLSPSPYVNISVSTVSTEKYPCPYITMGAIQCMQTLWPVIKPLSM